MATLGGILTLTQAVGAVAAGAVAGTVEIAVSTRVVTYGRDVTISGRLSSGDDCVEGRALLLEWRGAGSATFETVASGSAAADGAFAFTDAEAHSGSYRVSAPAAGTCDPAASDEASVRVRALVEGTSAEGSAVAGSCVELSASVTPPKPGQTVEVQRRTEGGWAPVEALVLDGSSSATARPCFAWGDVGVVRLRVRWPSQDPLNETGIGLVSPLRVRPAGWMRTIEGLVAGRAMSVSVGEAGTFLYERAPEELHTPASNEKLLLSMVLLDTFGADFRTRTIAASREAPVDDVVDGDLWILGRGDPEVDRGTLAALAREIEAAGVRRVDGRVLGATSYFRRDWTAPGWHENARDYVALPTALTFEGNLDRRGRNARDPEARAAAALTEELEDLGVVVRGRPGAGRPPSALTAIGEVRSRTLQAILARLLRPSDNFYAEVLGKRLGVETAGAPGTIAKGAAALGAWVEAHGVGFSLNDSSGMSYANRVTAEGIVRLLRAAEAAPWGDDLFDALPTGGQGTLRDRLHGVPMRAKTGTLTGISALSGWVWLERAEAWAEFSILSSGMAKATASEIEDRIVRLVHDRAR